MRNKKIVLVSCTSDKEKSNKPIPARDLYGKSSRFEKKIKYAESLQPDMILILSGKHGVVELNQPLDYYDHYLGDESRAYQKEWANRVLDQLEDNGCDLKNDVFIILASELYYHDLIPYMSKYELPMKGVNMYEDQKWLNDHIKPILKRENVKKLRSCRCDIVDQSPGYYIWWFHKSCVRDLLSPLPNVRYDKLIVDKDGFVALYVGIASKEPLVDRALWHICQNHTQSNVRTGYLSTLRQTISALLGIDMTQSEQKVNYFMDKYCELEWHPTDSGREAEAIEREELSSNYYPLNIRDNKVVSRDILSELGRLREYYRR